MLKKAGRSLPRREQIVNAARKLVIKHGSENVTIRRIAGEVGFSEAAIYRHFKSKKDILYLLIESMESILLSDLNAGKGDTYSRLEEVLMNHLSAVEMRRGISFQVIAEIVSLGDKRLNRRINAAIYRYISRLKELLDEGVKRGDLNKNIDTEAAALIVFCMLQGMSNIWTLSNYSFDPKEKFRPVLGLIRRALT